MCAGSKLVSRSSGSSSSSSSSSCDSQPPLDVSTSLLTSRHSDATSHSRRRSGALTQRQATSRLRYRHMTSQNMAFLGESVVLSLHTTSDLSTELCHWLEERDLLYRPVVRRPLTTGIVALAATNDYGCVPYSSDYGCAPYNDDYGCVPCSRMDVF